MFGVMCANVHVMEVSPSLQSKLRTLLANAVSAHDGSDTGAIMLLGTGSRGRSLGDSEITEAVSALTITCCSLTPSSTEANVRIQFFETGERFNRAGIEPATVQLGSPNVHHRATVAQEFRVTLRLLTFEYIPGCFFHFCCGFIYFI